MQYLGSRFYWDVAFPIVYGPCLALVLLFLVGRSQLDGWWAYAAFALPLAGAGFDIAENFAVRDMIAMGPAASIAQIQLASHLTVIKFVLVLPAFVIGLLGMVAILGRRSFRRCQDQGRAS